MAKGVNNASNKKSNSSKPYDASNSFVKKVASRVGGLIPQKSWLSGWFSTPNEDSNSPDEAQSARTDHEEDNTEDHTDQPPPTKRIKLPDKNYESEIFAPDARSSSGCSKDVKKSSQGDFMDISSVPGPSGQQKGAPSRGFVASTPADPELKANGDDCSESAESTSGCSSLEPQMTRAPGVLGQQGRSSESVPSRFLDERFNYPSYLQSPRSLFLDRSSTSRSNQSASRRKPSFTVSSGNSSLFGDRSMNETMVNSPFYSGRTMYGGASSSPYRRSFGSASFTSPAGSDRAGRHTVKVKPSPAQSNVDTGMSETARRILATLEQFSTPLLDAKRIPVSTTPQPVLASTSRKRPRQNNEEPRITLNAPRSPQLTGKGVHWAKGPPVSELSVPNIPDTLRVHRKERFTSAADEALLRQRERLQDSTTAARRLANSVPASNVGLERTYTLRSEDDEPSTGKQQSLKMKSQSRTKIHQSSKEEKWNEPPEEVNLPKIALRITTLPSFDIPVAKPAPPAPSSASPSTMTKTFAKSSAATSPITPSFAPKAPSKTSSASFTFASPIVVASEHKPVSPVAFVFSEPDSIGEKGAPSATGLNFLPSVPSRTDKTGLKRKSVTVNENGSDATVYSLKPASELRTGSVMDILGKGAKDTKEVNGSVSLMDKFKPAAGTWECDQCMIRNKADLSRCAACTNPRPAAGGKATANTPVAADPPKVPSVVTKSDSGFGAQFKLSGSDMWECSSCLVRNKSASGECVACGTAKPGPAPAKPLPTTTTSISGWGDKFKPAGNTWECQVCMVRNSSDLNACQACTTKRPGVAKAAPSTTTSNTTSSWGDKFKKVEGSWDCSDCMVNNKSASSKCVACGAKKPGSQDVETTTSSAPKFSFGVPPATSSGFTFGVKPSEKTEEKPASTSGFKFGSTAATVPTTGFSFGIPAATPASSSTSSTSAPSTTTTTTSTPAARLEKPMFSFGVPKPSTQDTPKTDSSTQEKVATVSFGQTPSESPEPSRKRKSTGEAGSIAISTETPKLSTPSSMFSASLGKETSTTMSSSNNLVATPSATKSVEPATPQKPTPVFGGFSANQNTPSPASLFKFGADNTSATTSPKVTSAVSIENPKPSQEVKPFFGSTTTPSLNSTPTFAFGQTSSEAPKPVLPTFGAISKAPSPAKPSFTFGQTSSEPSKAADAPKPSDSFTSKPTFAFGQVASEPTKPAEAPKTVTFGSATTETPEKPTFNFQPSSDTTLKPLGGFSNPTNTSTMPMFGSANTFPSFGSSSSATTLPTFGSSATANPTASGAAPSPAPATSAPVFGAPTNPPPAFGSSFGSTEKAEAKPPGVFTFGAATTKPAGASPFAFGASTPTVNGPTFGAQSSAPKAFSAFNAAPTNNAPASTPGFNFGGSAPAFGASGSNAASLFGSSNVPSFGAPSQPTFNATPTFGAASSANPAPTPASQFNFSANQSSGVFTFGGNPAPQNSGPATPFSFTAKPAQAPPTFNPNATPNFNFTAGGAVNFTATPGDGKPMPPRVIKKAMRRTQPR